jgi:hypothetical protein
MSSQDDIKLPFLIKQLGLNGEVASLFGDNRALRQVLGAT